MQGDNLNLGCGRFPKAGFLNVDWNPGPGVDLVHDLTRIPYPFADGRFDATDNGLYTITLNADAVRASNGTATTAGIISKFLVSARQRGGAGRGRSLEIPAGLPAATVVPPTSRRDDDRATSMLSA